MASSKPPLKVTISPGARAELKAIYAYNAEHRSPVEADRWEDFLLEGIDQLTVNHPDGKIVQGFPGLQEVTLRRSNRGHGHVVIFRVDLEAQNIRILHIYHTRQDISGRLRREGNW